MDPTDSMPGRVVAALAVTIALLLAGGVGAAVSVGGRTSPGPPEIDGEAATDLAAVLPVLQSFVEQARGLAFKTPVEVKLLDDDDFGARLAERSDHEADRVAEVQAAQDVLRALGLLRADVDLAEAIESLLDSAVTGFYDPRTDELVVRGRQPTPNVRATLVHELTHALQDQHFELHRPDLDDRDDEAADAFTALVEGDAERIEALYLRSLPEAERRAVAAAEQAAAGRIDPDVPPVLLQVLGFPYVAGPIFVEELVARGGQPALDRAFLTPPVTTEQVLHPEAFLGGDGPRDVRPPPADGELIDEGVVGELGLLLVLATVLSRADASEAARGWGGDRYVAWRSGSTTCVRAAMVMDSPRDRAELTGALGRWAGRRAGATVTATAESEPVVFTACG